MTAYDSWKLATPPSAEEMKCCECGSVIGMDELFNEIDSAEDLFECAACAYGSACCECGERIASDEDLLEVSHDKVYCSVCAQEFYGN